MAIKDDSFEMLDLGQEKITKKPNFLAIGLLLLLAAGGGSAYMWYKQQPPVPPPAVNIPVPAAPAAPAPAPPVAPPPAPTKKVPTPINIVIRFDPDSAVIRPDAMAELQALAKLITDNPGTMQISAYTDDVGSDAMGQALSEQRAEAVIQVFKSLGVNGQIKYNVGAYGELYPVADNLTEAGRALNRRVEIYFSPTL